MAKGHGLSRVWRNVLAILVAAGVTSGLTALPVFDTFHGRDTDLLHWLRDMVAPDHGDPADSPVAVIAITPDSYNSPALAGIPRVMWTDPMAAVQRKVLDAGASVFGWDIILQNLAAPSLQQVMKGRVELDPQTRRGMNRLDASLLAGMKTYAKAGKIVLGTASLGHGTVNPNRALVMQVRGGRNLRSTNAYTDPDGIVRGVPLFVRAGKDGSETVPGFALELASRYLGQTPVQDDDGSIRLGDHRIPVFQTPGGGENLIVDFDTGPGAIPTFAFDDLVTCEDPTYFQQNFSGRIVIFGLVEEFEDRKPMSTRLTRSADFANAPAPCGDRTLQPSTVVRNTEAGVYLHAQAARDLILGTGVERLGGLSRLGIVFALALVGAGLAAWRRPPVALVGWLLAVTIYLGLAAAVFRTGVELPLLDPAAAGSLALAGMIGFRFVTADQERRLVRRTFSHYLDRKVIEAMIDSGDVPELGGETRNLTCFFSDLEAFSSISENMGPVELVEFLNVYFDIIGSEIEAHGGIIERFLGDAVCAVFGAPVRDGDHAANAVRCALAIDARLQAAQDRFDVPEGRQVRTRIGINTGAMTAGNVGAERRKTYTVMGDATNLAARLESVNKQYGTLLLAGDETVAATGSLFEWRLLDRVRVVGRATPVGLYEPLGPSGSVPSEILARRDAYEAALAAFQKADFGKARDAFAALADQGDSASAKAVARCEAFIADPPPDGWQGVTDLTKK